MLWRYTNKREKKQNKKERERRRRKEIELTDDVRYDERISIVQHFKFKRRALVTSFSLLGLFLCLSFVSRVLFEISEERLPCDGGEFTSWFAAGAYARLAHFPLVPSRISRPCIHPLYLHLSHWPPFSLADRNAYQHWPRTLNFQPGIDDQHIGLRVQRTNKHFFLSIITRHLGVVRDSETVTVFYQCQLLSGRLGPRPFSDVFLFFPLFLLHM